MITIPHSEREKYYRAKRRQFERINKKRAQEKLPPLEWKPFWNKEQIALATLKNPETGISATEGEAMTKAGGRKTNQDIMKFNAAIMKIRTHADPNDIETLYTAAQEYMNLCTQMDMRVTNQSLYFACGVNRDIIDGWFSGKTRSKEPAYREFATYCRQFCSMARAQIAEEGLSNPVYAIWQQKVFDGYRDDVKPVQGYSEVDDSSSDAIAAKYEDFTDD